MNAAQGKHILIVEDEEHLAVGLKYNLQAEGYTVTLVPDGPAALKAVAEAEPPVDLVVLDLMLPGMSGYAVCKSLRSSGEDLPVLMLSARTLSEDRTRGFDVGTDQYLTKPFDLDELLSRIKNLLARYEGRALGRAGDRQSIARYEFAGSRIDFETYEVTVRGETVRLTQLEMKLLRHFIEHEGRVIPRRELLDEVWGLRGRLNTRAPDQFIRRLRKIFEPDPATPRHFLTIRDVGYRFVAAGEEVGE